MEPNPNLFYRLDKSDIQMWPIFHFFSKKDIENIKVAVVFGNRGGSAVYVTQKDEVFGMGSNEYHMLGNSEWKDDLKPRKVEPLCGKKIKYFTVGDNHVMALTEEGIVYNWGNNDFSQLGTKNPNDTIGPSVVGTLFDKKVIEIACSSSYNIVLCDNYQVYEWGKRSTEDYRSNTSVETLVEGKLKGEEIVSVACSKVASFALSSHGCVYSWGLDSHGILGRNCNESTNEGKNNPSKISNLTGVFIKKIVAGQEHILVLSNAGVVYSWGKNDCGQLGYGEIKSDVFSSVPEEIEFLRSDGSVSTRKIIDIAATHFCSSSVAMDENCQLFIWGQCKGQNICSPLATDFNSLQEIFVNLSHYTGTFRPITSKNLTKAKIYKHIKNAFEDEATSDLTILVEGKEIKVHKAVLRIRSNYFKNMLKQGWKENEDEVLEIKESTYIAYKALIEYFYTDDLNVPFSFAFELLDLARVYCEEELREMCEKVIKNNISIDNVASSYATAKSMRVDDLKTFCMEFMMNNFSNVVISEDFARLNLLTVREILNAASRSYPVFKT
ncbi:RCC1 and BTB domain-containing protein 1-like isoform X2 [Planococcus citri]|uniref:RCC1 and BTB domain-containing protein 1-like isoform X2 n=1 Tax=Planococcus citri TaxID=170843 RepID=UPI0031F96277